MIKTVIFDFFDVIRTDSYKAWLRKRGQALEGGYLEANQQMDRGEIDAQEFLRRLGRLTNERPEKIFEDMEAATEINYDVLALIDELRRRYPIGLLSNAPSAFIRDILHQHDLEKYFDTIVISSEVGMIKPEPDIFHYILRQMDSLAHETIFIDDNAHNVQAALTLGLDGIVFEDQKQLRRELADHGLL